MPRVLITGITGFIGSALEKRFRTLGYDVFGTTTGRPQSSRHYTCNVSSTEGLEELLRKTDPDIIIHCAAISTVTELDSSSYYLVNVIGTKNVLAAARKLNREIRFIFFSTAGVYGNQNVDLLHESLLPLPVHDYGMSKWCAERWVGLYGDLLQYTIVRPFNIFGIGQTINFIIPKLAIAFATEQREIRLGNIDVYRDYLDIMTFCRQIELLIASQKSFGETVNLCSGQPTSLNQLIDTFQTICDYEISITSAPELIREKEVWKLIGSRAKLDRLIDDREPPRPIEDCLREMIAYYRSAKK